jgi:hypothetical protein
MRRIYFHNSTINKSHWRTATLPSRMHISARTRASCVLSGFSPHNLPWIQNHVRNQRIDLEILRHAHARRQCASTGDEPRQGHRTLSRCVGHYIYPEHPTPKTQAKTYTVWHRSQELISIGKLSRIARKINRARAVSSSKGELARP